jgi:hypothetical protein
MPSNPEKIVGNSGRCFKCNNPIYCREKEYQGEKKAQWQNQDGKAHYDKDGGCKVEGKGFAETYTAPKSETKVVWSKLEEPSKDQLLLVDGLRELRSLAYDFTKETHPELSENTALFGQINNANMTHLLSLMHIKAVKESS